MQTVDILCDKSKLSKAVLPVRQLSMRRIRLELGQDVSPVIKPLPHCGKIAFDHCRGGDDVERHSLPDSRVTSTAKRRHSRLCRHARARQDENPTGAGEAPPQF